VLVVLTFILFRALDSFPFTKTLSLWIAGFVALDGLNAALVYTGWGNRKWLGVFGLVGAAGVILYLCGRRWLHSYSGLFLLSAYFAVTIYLAWTTSWNNTFPFGFPLLWPALDRFLETSAITKNSCPLLGFVLAVIWGLWVQWQLNPEPN
jgi:hypothetical protein